jgi:hypothetical protein
MVSAASRNVFARSVLVNPRKVNNPACPDTLIARAMSFGVMIKPITYLYCTSNQQSAEPIVFVAPVLELQSVIPVEK